MDKEFVPYAESLELRDVGFDVPCFGYYIELRNPSEGILTIDKCENNIDGVLAPTFSQAFKLFREKYGYDCLFEDELVYDDDDKEIEMWDFFIYKTKQASDKKMTFCSNNHGTYVESFCREEAELACLRKLIEIVKNKENVA